MKKMLLKFADNLLSKEQMKQVKGGYGGAFGTCTATCSGGVSISCTSRISCSSTDNQGVMCDNVTTCCPGVKPCIV